MGREQLRHAFDESIEFGNIVATLSASGQPSAAVSSLATARIDPFNETGDQLRSRDCEWGVTLLSLPGRSGLDLGLGLSYSSLVWTRSGPYAYFDEDRGSPSLGFRLGFATIQGPFFDAQVGRNAYVLVTSSGSRTELRQVGTTSTYEAGDSSYLQLIAGSSSLLVRSTDGTQMSYAPLGDGWRATAIEDRNGNLINVSYDWRGDITNVTDTLGRVITFNYDTNANLSTIMQSWQGNSAAQPHKWARFDWNNVTLQPSFALSAVGTYGGETIPVLEQVWLDDDTHYSFEYTGAGQVNVIRRYSSDNLERSRTTYDYATLADDCPRVIDTRVWADNWTGINGVPSEVITQFNDPGDGSHEMIAPDGTVYKESYGTGWQKGLVTGSEVRSGGTLQKQTTRQWTQDDTSAGYQTNPRVIETNIYDFPVNTPSNRRRTTIDYGQYAQYGLPHLVTEYASDGTTPLRQSYTDYNLAQGYLDRRIIGLVSSSQVYDSTAAKWLSKTTYAFDEPGSVQQQAVAAAGHDQSYDSTFLTRGNVSSASRWDVTDITNTAKTLTSRVSYDAAGSALTATDPAGHQSSISYADSYSDSNNSRNTFAYPTTLTDADGFSSSVQYNFDFGAKTRVQGPPPANQSNGIIQTFAYDSAARIQQVTTTNNGAYTRYLYGPNYVATQATVNAVADEAYTNTVFDGMGRTFLVGSNNPGSTSGYKAQVTRYDLMGRAVKQSNPAETDNAWNPVGPDDGAGWLYTQQSYDWKGRPRITTNTDGTQKSATYDGCGCAGGEVVTLTDEVGRQQKVYSDSLGRQWKSEVLNWDGSIYSTETSTLDTLDRVTFARQYQGTDQSGVYEETAMTYDGYGRLQSRHAPEQDAGRSTTYAYNPDNTLASVTDARGAVTTYNYNDARRLVTNVSYTAPSDITLPPSVTFGYDAAGNRTSMTTDGGAGGGVTYHYDTLSRVTSEDRQFPGLSGAYTLAYEYTLAGALKKLTDPVGDSISYGFDQTGRLTGVTGSSFAGVTTYASGITYRAWGAPKGVTYDGDSGSATTTYDERMRPQQHTLSVPATPANFNTGTSMREQYQYDGDGRLQQMTDLDDHSAMPGSPSTERRFSRRYTYDHAGRLTAASGVGASGQSYGLPFNQTFVYDEFDNLNQRYGSYYYEGYTQDVATFQNDRRQDWTYDADGRVVHSPFTATWNGVTGARDWSYDAAGRMTQVRDTKTSNGTTTTSTYVSSYDGDGLSVRSYSQESSTTSNSYMVRSTVLGGEVVTWLDNAGRKSKTVVKVDGLLMALQYPATVSGAQPFVTWLHSDPARMSEVTNGSGDKKSVYDPLGNYVSFQELPAPPAGYNPLYSPPPSGGLGSGFGFNGGSTNVACTLNGSPVNCNDAMHALDVGKASPCPNNDCGPQHISGEDENGKKGGGWVFFNGSGNFYSNGQDSGFADPDDVEYRDAYDPNSWAMNWGPKKRKEGGSRKRPKHVSQTTLPTPTPTQNPTPNPMSLLDRGTFYDSLGPCLQQELAPYYKMDLSKVRIHHFIPLAPKYIEHPSGYTAGWDVYFKSFLDRQGQFTDLAYEDMFHELAHVEQFQAGFFYEKYALNFGLNLYVGMPREKAYLFTQQEIDARKKASYVLQDYKSKHNGKLPCH
jgi:YD repeat-containing protein